MFGAAPPRDWALPLHLRQTISSQLDADRFDYLLRDSHYTGVDYGTFDSHWLLEHLYVDEYRGVYVSQKARDALETYVFARYHMYHAVYYHKATRAGEVMLRLLLETYTKALEAAETDEAKEAVVPGAPFEVLNAFSSEMSLDQYLQLDDYVMNVFFRRCASCDNPVLNELGAGLLNRRLWKCRDLTHLQPNRLAGLISAVRLWLRDEGEPDTLFQDDTPGDTPYKPYDPPGRPDEGEAMEKLIWLQKPDGELGELSGQLGTIDELTERYLLVRYYFPERLRDKLCDFMDDWLSKN
ncbi:MAG: hypothetical protein Q8K99_00205 [Actinomycetota bacterium]|nr:hypothetical protein [Actinomycetota bacterium]